MRSFRVLTILLTLLFLRVLSYGQVPVGVVNDGVKTLVDNNFLHPPASGFGQATPSSSPKPKEDLAFLDFVDTPDFQAKHADSMRVEGSVYFLEGDCLFLVRGYRVTCDEAQYDRLGNRATLIGHVHVDGDLFAVKDADTVSVDFSNISYVAKNGQAKLSPQLIQGNLKDYAYVTGEETYGTQDQITTLNGTLTTCNYPVPHYDIEARSTVLRPGRRVIFRHTKIRILGHVVAELPFLSIPLDDRSSKYVPYVGENDIEGYFAKWVLDFPTKNPNYNIETREDFMSKLGVGLGLGYSYVNHLSQGTVSIYHVFGSSDDLTLDSNHRQVFNWGSLQESTDYEKDNYLVAPDSTIFNTKWMATIPQGTRATDQITFADSVSSSYGYNSGTETIGLNDRRDFGQKITSTTTITYMGTSSAYAGVSGQTGTDTAEIDVNSQIQKDFNAATLALQYERSIPVGSSNGYITTSNETPVITLTSDARRLFGPSAANVLPFQTTLSWGEFQDPRDGANVEREYFDFNFNKVDTSQSKLRFDYNGDFNQGFYSDQTSQYVLGAGANLRYDLGGTTGLNLRYNYDRPFGYTPLTVDFTGYTNYLSEDLNFKPQKDLLLGVQTGFDFARMQQGETGWQQVGIRSEYQPSKYFMMRGLFTYDTYNMEWEDARIDVTYLPGATRVILGVDYDAESHLFSSIDLMIQNFKSGRVTCSTALSYDGYIHTFDNEQISLVYDLHCAEAVLSVQENNYGFNAGQQASFFIRLKALPFDTPFGTGTRGQPVGLTSGSTF